jgi:hypothetical protein
LELRRVSGSPRPSKKPPNSKSSGQAPGRRSMPCEIEYLLEDPAYLPMIVCEKERGGWFSSLHISLAYPSQFPTMSQSLTGRAAVFTMNDATHQVADK